MTQANSSEALKIDGPTAISLLGSVATPVALAMTGMSYVAGWQFHRKLLGAFGLGAQLPDLTFQETMAVGFRPVSLGVLPLIALIWFLWKVHQVTTRLPQVPPEEVTQSRRRVAFTSAFALFCTAGISGAFLGRYDAYRIKGSLAGDCSHCFVYRVRRTNIVGIPIFQSKERTVIAANGGAFIIPTADIHLVRPYRP